MRKSLEHTLNDQFPMRGRVSVDVYGQASGALLKTVEQRNMITIGGKSSTASWMTWDPYADPPVTPEYPPSFIALGTGSSITEVADNALESEIYRQQLTSKQNATVTVTYKLFVSTSSANGHTIREVGLFNAPASGFMFARAVLAQPIVKSTAITLTVAWTIDIG